MKIFVLNVMQRLYHRLPVSQAMKWRLRDRLRPLLMYLRGNAGLEGLVRAVEGVVVAADRSSTATRSLERERALSNMLQEIEQHVRLHGPCLHWLALPFLSTGGAQMAAMHFCRAIRMLRPEQSVLLLVTDRGMSALEMEVPQGVKLLEFDDFILEDRSYAAKQALLLDLLVACRPDVFHNINSEVAWHLIIEQGKRLQNYTQIFASIFAFQYIPGSRKTIGYAASFLKPAIPYLTGLITDNRRFVRDAVAEYGFSSELAEKFHVTYLPCKVAEDVRTAQEERSMSGGRLKVLWAGRLDAEKRVDLFLQIVRACDFAEFWVYGKVVLEEGRDFPDLPNLRYGGPFASPLEWVERQTYDAFLFTSRWEGMPNVLVEAGFLGFPVVAPAVGGVGEIISAETGYLLAEDPTVESYLQALNEIQRFPQEAKRRSAALQALVRERHSWGAFLGSMEALPKYFSPMSLGASREPGQLGHRPAVSVIIPCFNQGRYLVQSVTSALWACRNSSLEIIVVDDGSTDAHAERWLSAALALAPDVVRIHRQANAGLSGARNKGVALSRGEYIQFLDADDLLAPGKIDTQLAHLQVHRLADVSVCNFLLCDESVSIFSKPEEAIARFDLTLEDFLYRWERGFAIPIHCGLFRRSVLASDGPFDESARAKEDWIFWTELSLKKARCSYVHGHWAIYRQHEASMRRSYMGMGRAWLKAGLHLDSKVRSTEPLFFESVVSWFEQCYRGNSEYAREVAAIHGAKAGGSVVVNQTVAKISKDASPDPQEILRRLGHLDGDIYPSLTVIVPIYGHYKYLQECLLSLADQGQVAFEVICIDDASPDRRIPDLLKQLQGRLSRLSVRILEGNIGISAVQNMAVGVARGEYVVFLDCDDALESRALEIAHHALTLDPGIDYLFTDRTDVDESGATVRVARYGGYESIQFSSQEKIRDDLLDGMVASHLKIIRRSAYLEVGGSDDKYSGVQDWELALKISERYRLHYLDKALYRHRIHRGSVTRSDGVAQMRKTNLVRRRFTELRYQRNEEGLQEDAVVFLSADFPMSLNAFKEVWQAGLRCRVDMTGPMELSKVNYLREFNSYFDEILWSDAVVPVALCGYLHDSVSLHEQGSI